MRNTRCNANIVSIRFRFWAVNFRVHFSSEDHVSIISFLVSIDNSLFGCVESVISRFVGGAMSAFHINLLTQTYVRGMQTQPFVHRQWIKEDGNLFHQLFFSPLWHNKLTVAECRHDCGPCVLTARRSTD